MLSREALDVLIKPDDKGEMLEFEFTKRELQVLGLLVKGMSNPEIADKMVISRSTVKTHISNILSKMGVTNRTAAISLALKHKLVD